MNGDGPYYGKYRGICINNADPMKLGRIQAIVPDVSSLLLTTWALPCLPYGGANAGLFAVPEIAANVWVEFEQGDPDYPIWVGTYWGSVGEVPKLAQTVPPSVPSITLQTPGKNGMVICDTGGPSGLGGITLQSASGATIAVNDLGITISNGKGAQITLIEKTVDINLGGLTVITLP